LSGHQSCLLHLVWGIPDKDKEALVGAKGAWELKDHEGFLSDTLKKISYKLEKSGLHGNQFNLRGSISVIRIVKGDLFKENEVILSVLIRDCWFLNISWEKPKLLMNFCLLAMVL
jgi:hypothetical protein